MALVSPRSDRSVLRQVVTDATGNFHFDVGAGSYVLLVSRGLRGPQQRREVEVRSGEAPQHVQIDLVGVGGGAE